MEFDGLVRKRLSSPDHYFDTSFFNEVFKITGGHVGAILDFVNIIAATTSYRRLKGTGRSYTWSLFLAEVNPRDFIIRLESSSSIFLRGLPIKSELQETRIADTFIEVLKNNSIGQSDATNENAGLLKCSSNGWLHADKSLDGNETVYTFASPLHRWFMEWRLLDTLHTIPFECGSILQLVLGVIAGFSSSLLSTERRVGPGCIQRLPEVQYQDEFYRSCYTYSKGSLQTFPEFGTAEGRVDFYIPSKKWGVELLRDGNRLKEHSSRFSESGVYGTNLELSEFIILDCRKKWPMRRHPDIENMYHAVFSEDYREVSILDHLLQSVEGGQLRLLAA